MRSPLSIDHQNEAASSSSTFKGELWVISPEQCVSRVGSWTSWHSETPPGVHEVTEICILLDVLGLGHSHSLMSRL